MSYKQVKDDIISSNISNEKLLTPFQYELLQKSLQGDLTEMYRQRIQIMLLADEGKSQTQICQALGCCPATARHWIHIARNGMAQQWQTSPIGRPKAVNEEYLERLKKLVNDNPRNHGYSFQRWTANWLNKHLTKELGIKVSDCHVKRLLKQMGLSTKPKPNNFLKDKTQKTQNSQIFIADLPSEKILNKDDIAISS